jgi:ABC-type multidrug transport system ATPase subunit
MDEVEKVCDYVAILKAGSLHHAGTTKSVLATGGWVELAAADLAALEGAVRSLDAQATVERSGDLLLLRHSVLSTGELNRRLVDAGIVLHHLVQRHPSLESQYLALMGNGEKS